MNRIVARFQDGRLLKGLTNDFLPAKDRFHISPEERGAGAKPSEVRVAELKAVFFVKSLEGDAQHHKTNEPAQGQAVPGKRIRVVFTDGEVIVGTTQGYDRTRPGFFVVPIDQQSNNERCFVVTAATREVGFM
jgi:hypothetical protein